MIPILLRHLFKTFKCNFWGKRNLSIFSKALLIFFYFLYSNYANSQSTSAEQPKTLFKKGIIGIYAGPYYRYTKIDGNWTDISGGGGGIYIKNRFFIAGSSFGQWNPGKSATYPDRLIKLTLNGATIGVNSNPNKLIHFNLGLFVGGGKAVLMDSKTQQEYENMKLTFINPMLDAEINVYEAFRFFAGIDYRFALSDNKINGLTTDKFSGFSLFWGIKTGLF
jgi:hypothetical protein